MEQARLSHTINYEKYPPPVKKRQKTAGMVVVTIDITTKER
jgi:hypothetical protein